MKKIIIAKKRMALISAVMLIFQIISSDKVLAGNINADMMNIIDKKIQIEEFSTVETTDYTLKKTFSSKELEKLENIAEKNGINIGSYVDFSNYFI